jgi:purine-binding chemotaxis protein CheW
VSVHLRVRLGAEHYALAVEQVLEVAELGVVMPVPGADARVTGIRNLRGRILPVIDLAALVQASGNGAERIVVAESTGRVAGLAVDEVMSVTELPEALQARESDLLEGAVLVDDQLVGVLDVDRIFDALELEGA